MNGSDMMGRVAHEPTFGLSIINVYDKYLNFSLKPRLFTARAHICPSGAGRQRHPGARLPGRCGE